MSFHFEFVASNKAVALRRLAEVEAQHAEHELGALFAFVRTAITNVRTEGALAIKATGHLCTTHPASYETSGAQIQVKPLGDQFVA